MSNGCSGCGQFPYLKTTGMCGVCTFGSWEAQEEMINGGYEEDEIVWSEPFEMCITKHADVQEAIDELEKIHVSYTVHNHGTHLKIKLQRGVIDYWPTTRRCRFNKNSEKLARINSTHYRDIIDFIKTNGAVGVDYKPQSKRSRRNKKSKRKAYL